MSNIIGRAQPRLLAYGENDRDFKTLRPPAAHRTALPGGWVNVSVKLTLTCEGARVPAHSGFAPATLQKHTAAISR